MIAHLNNYKKTKTNNVISVVREHYLRNDIPCFSESCQTCENDPNLPLLSSEQSNGLYILPDEEVIINQIDLIEKEHNGLCNFIIIQTILDRIRKYNMSVYNRVLRIIKDDRKHFIMFSNEFHQRTFVSFDNVDSISQRTIECIKRVKFFYEDHISMQNIKIQILINNDESMVYYKDIDLVDTIHNYVSKLDDPTLMDYLNEPNLLVVDKHQMIYNAHINVDTIQSKIKQGILYQGVYHSNPDNWKEGNVNVKGFNNSESTRILIKGLENINRSVDGDLVAIEILNQDEWTSPSLEIHLNEENNVKETLDCDNSSQNKKLVTNIKLPSGRIVGIIKRNWKTYCGSIDVSNINNNINSHWVFVIPVDKKIPKVRIKTSQHKFLINKRIFVNIDEWPQNSLYPLGHYHGTIGEIGDKATEENVILFEHNIPTYEFSADVIKCLPPKDWAITADNSKGRLDLRERHMVVSIDPPGCKDIDDALSALKIDNNTVEIGVHIADVSYYVRPDTAMDKEAALRANTTYLVERRLDMLPKLLTENLCSLVQGQDRFAFSAIFKMDMDGNILERQFCKTIIHNIKAMTYQEAQTIIDDIHISNQMKESLIILNHISKKLKENRFKNGALMLASPEVRFVFDSESHNPISMTEYLHFDTHSLVEEFMLLANCAVAERTYHFYPNYAILRRHPQPDQKRFDELKALLNSLNIDLKTESSSLLSQSLDKAVIHGVPYFNTLVRIMTTRCMMQAAYFPANEYNFNDFTHYGLASPIYTHFTSPIRRYSDIMVHRYLSYSLGIESLIDIYQDTNFLHELCGNLNQRHLMSQLAGRASVEQYTLIFFKEKKRETALIMKCKANGIVVMIPKFGIEGIIYLTQSKNDVSDYTYDTNKLILIHKTDPTKNLKPFQPITVDIGVKDTYGYRQQLLLELVDCNPMGIK